MPKRTFLPPSVCDVCNNKPLLGQPLWHSGELWICSVCLTQVSEGDTVVSKATRYALKADLEKSLSKRERAAGNIEAAFEHEHKSNWHAQASSSIKTHASNQLKSLDIAHGEVVNEGKSWLKDTLSSPDLAAIDSSYVRGSLLESNNITALGVDVSNTTKASNTAEKLISHQLALAHKIAFEQAAIAQREHDAAIQIKRLQLVSKMMKASQEAALTLQKLKSAGTQNITVQHVHVEAGGQALVGNVNK